MQQLLASWVFFVVCFLLFVFVFCFFHFKSQTTRKTDDDLEFIIQHKFNQVFEYSDNDGENLKQLSAFLHITGKTKLLPLRWVANTL